MDDALDGRLELLYVEAIEVNVRRGMSPDEDRQQVFGGQLAGQAPVAAGRAVDADRRVHSLHAYSPCHGDGALAGSLLHEGPRPQRGAHVVRRLALVVAVLLAAGACSSGASTTTTTTTGLGATTPTSRSDRAQRSVDLTVTEVATGLDTVWAMKFDAKGKLWFTQRGGRLQQLDGPGRDIPGVVEQGEGGLMGLELDDAGRIYVMMTTREDNRIVRLDHQDADPVVVVGGLRKAAIHNGGRLRFGPDGTLYAGTGDSGDTSLPPRGDSLNGKILAIDTSTARATIFTTGHRNPQGLCFNGNGRFLSTEHGPERGDEVNLIDRGRDYGWPDSTGDGIKNWTPTIAPAGCAMYEADAIPQWKGSLLFVTLKEQDLRRLTFAADGSVSGEEVLYDGTYGRLRDVAVAPDGSVYLATSNRDTRGDPRAGDDRILRIEPRP